MFENQNTQDAFALKAITKRAESDFDSLIELNALKISRKMKSLHSLFTREKLKLSLNRTTPSPANSIDLCTH